MKFSSFLVVVFVLTLIMIFTLVLSSRWNLVRGMWTVISRKTSQKFPCFLKQEQGDVNTEQLDSSSVEMGPLPNTSSRWRKQKLSRLRRRTLQHALNKKKAGIDSMV